MTRKRPLEGEDGSSDATISAESRASAMHKIQRLCDEERAKVTTTTSSSSSSFPSATSSSSSSSTSSSSLATSSSSSSSSSSSFPSATSSFSSLSSFYSTDGTSFRGREVREQSGEEVREAIERFFLTIAADVLAEKGLKFDVPSRSSSNQQYVPEQDRIVLKDATSSRSLSNVGTVRKTALSLRVMEFIHEILSKQIHITKRDLFYSDVKLFQKQTESDTIIEDTACLLGCTRNSLNVVASERGVVVGRISFRDYGDLIDCSRMGVGGKAIPPLIDRVTDIQSDAKFILLVEKDAAFIRLSEDRFYNDYPCIIITGKGQPDVATRLFLKKVKTALRIPVLCLVDSDPYGLKILSVYMSGSKSMSYDSASLTVSDIKWLGIRPSDLDAYSIPKECRLAMNEGDIKTGKELLNEDFIKKNPQWVKELEMMVKRKEKAEIQALSKFGFQFLTKTYLPEKLAKGDWI